MKWRFAIIGCGHIGLRHAALAAKYGELVAVCDNDPRKLDNQLFAGCSRFTDATEKQAADFAKVRTKIIEPAVKELREKDGWLIQWQPVKAGRKVKAVRFTFMRDPQGSLPFSQH